MRFGQKVSPRRESNFVAVDYREAIDYCHKIRLGRDLQVIETVDQMGAVEIDFGNETIPLADCR